MPARVLIVEDNPDLLAVLREVLSQDYEVQTARRGEDAIVIARTFQPNVVLLDLQLPGIDGHETLRRLRDGVLPDGVPVVAVTALAMAEDRDRARRAGFDGYLEKPISPRALPAQVERFLGGGAW